MVEGVYDELLRELEVKKFKVEKMKTHRVQCKNTLDSTSTLKLWKILIRFWCLSWEKNYFSEFSFSLSHTHIYNFLTFSLHRGCDLPSSSSFIIIITIFLPNGLPSTRMSMCLNSWPDDFDFVFFFLFENIYFRMSKNFRWVFFLLN